MNKIFSLFLCISSLNLYAAFTVTDTRRSPGCLQRQRLENQKDNMEYLSGAALYFNTSSALCFNTSTPRELSREEYFDCIDTLQKHVNKGEAAAFIQQHGAIDSVVVCKNDLGLCPEVGHTIRLTAADGATSGVIRIQK